MVSRIASSSFHAVMATTTFGFFQSIHDDLELAGTDWWRYAIPTAKRRAADRGMTKTKSASVNSWRNPAEVSRDDGSGIAAVPMKRLATRTIKAIKATAQNTTKVRNANANILPTSIDLE